MYLVLARVPTAAAGGNVYPVELRGLLCNFSEGKTDINFSFFRLLKLAEKSWFRP